MMSDRYLTGDDVEFCSTSSLKALLQSVFGQDAIRREALIGRGKTTSPSSFGDDNSSALGHCKSVQYPAEF